MDDKCYLFDDNKQMTCWNLDFPSYFDTLDMNRFGILVDDLLEIFLRYEKRKKKKQNIINLLIFIFI